MALLSVAAQAQFKLDEAPSAQRAATAKAFADTNGTSERLQDRAKRKGIQPLSSIGDSQSATQTIQPATPATAVQAYAGTQTVTPRSPALSADGKALPIDPSSDNPNKPRQPLKPKSLSQGVAPR